MITLRDSDRFVNYVFQLLQEKLKNLDKALVLNGSSGLEGSDLILTDLKRIFQVLLDYGIRENPESSDELLLPCIENLVTLVSMVGSHFDSKTEEFYKMLDTLESKNDVIGQVSH